ncbi:MAG: hypothetical protein WC211_00720 [Dehalococcoidia bacterium]
MATQDEREAARLFDAPGQTLSDAWGDVVSAPDGAEAAALSTAVRIVSLLVMCGEINVSRALDEVEFARAAVRCGLTARDIRARLATGMCTLRVSEWRR